MRLSYNDRHWSSSAGPRMRRSFTREQQRALLLDTARLLRESYVLHAGVPDICYLWGEEADFCRKLPLSSATTTSNQVACRDRNGPGTNIAERKPYHRIHPLRPERK